MTIAPAFDKPSRGKVGPADIRRTLMETSHVSALQLKHAGLERQLQDEMSRPLPDNALIQQLKKRKLRIKEQIAFA